MVILLYGPESFRRTRRLKSLIEEFKKKNPGALMERFNLEGMTTANSSVGEFFRLKEFIINKSIFTEKKLGIIQNVWSSESVGRAKKAEKEIKDTRQQKELKKNLELAMNSGEISFFIIEDKKPPVVFKFLTEKPAISEEFEELSGQKLKKFAEKEAEGLSLSFEPAALDFLIDYYKENTWGLMTEIGKLRWLKREEGKSPVSFKELKKIGDYPQEENIFYFINMFNYPGGLSRKIQALEKLFLTREEPAKIFNILAASNYIPPELLEKMADYDVLVKAGKMDYEEILLDLALN